MEESLKVKLIDAAIQIILNGYIATENEVSREMKLVPNDIAYVAWELNKAMEFV